MFDSPSNMTVNDNQGHWTSCGLMAGLITDAAGQASRSFDLGKCGPNRDS